MVVSVNGKDPLVVQLPKATRSNYDYSCQSSGAQLQPPCTLGEIAPGDLVTIQMVEQSGNRTLMHRGSCRFFSEDLSAPLGPDGAPGAPAPLTCSSKDAMLRVRCDGCAAAQPPTAFATLRSVSVSRLSSEGRRGHVALACQAPSTGRFLLQMPGVSTRLRDYNCRAAGASSCRLAALAPGDRIACAIANLEQVGKPQAALLQASACRPGIPELQAAGGQVCQGTGARLTLGCAGCGGQK